MAEMNKEVLMVVESVSHEKGVSKDVIFEAIEQALATATQKKYRENARFCREHRPGVRQLRDLPDMGGDRSGTGTGGR